MRDSLGAADVYVGQAFGKGGAGESGAEEGGEAMGDPLGEEIDAGLGAVANVGAGVEKFVRGKGLAEPGGEAPADRGAEVVLREGDEADVGAAFEEIEIERD